VKQQVNKAKFC